MESLILAAAMAWMVCGVPTAASPLSIAYTVRVDSTDLSAIAVDMSIRGAPADFRVAMVTHTEYDDRYWRGLTDLHASGAVVAREDSSVWRVVGAPGNLTLHYRVRLPETQSAWMAHLTRSGGLLGGPHTFLYVIGEEEAPVSVTMVLPPDWTIATGLNHTVNARTFSASGIEALVDSPILIGRLRTWQFDILGATHDVALLGRTNGAQFDTARFVSNLERIALESARTLGAMPYRRYQFLVEDGMYGALEHSNSVSIGAQSAELARDPDVLLGQIAHEFIHTWNEVHVRPSAWIGVRHVAPQPTGELWWSEGVTLYFADLVLRRAGLRAEDSTRVAHLERYIASYVANPSHALVSPEETSRAFNMPPSVTGDLTPSMFTQGELIGVMLDLMIRQGSGGTRMLDDAMRELSARFDSRHGITGADIESAVSTACSCNARPFFDAYVRSAGAIDFDTWLAVIGLHAVTTWAPARASNGTLSPDTRVSSSAARADSTVALRIWYPGTLWQREGFHTGDAVEQLNGIAIRGPRQFRDAVARLSIGDSVHVRFRRLRETLDKTFVVAGYDRPTVRLERRADATPQQLAMLERWKAGR